MKFSRYLALPAAAAAGVVTAMAFTAAAAANGPDAATTQDAPALPAGHYFLPDGKIRVAGTPGAAAALSALQRYAGADSALQASLTGSDAAMPELLFGQAPFILLDRPISRTERVPYKKIHGAYPLSLRIARIADGQASGLTGSPGLYVNAANPLQAITAAQFAAILTQGQPQGEITDWGQLISAPGWAGKALTLIGPEHGDAELESLRAAYLDERPTTPRLQPQADAAARLHQVAVNQQAIALAESGHHQEGVREVAIAPSSSGSPDFARYLYVHVRRDANGLPDAIGAAFARAALSEAGAAALRSHAPGLAPLSAQDASRELALLGPRVAATPAPATPVLAPATSAATSAAASASTSATTPNYVQPDGSIFIVGNDGMQDLLHALNALFMQRNPGVAFKMRMEGSSTGGPALIAGVTPFAPLSRAMWDGDLQGFRQRYGYDPLDVRVGYTGHGPRATGKTPPALYVHRSNPLAALTMIDARRIYTRGNAPADLSTWGQLGLGGAWAHRSIHVYGLADDGGAATSARKLLLGGRPYTERYETLDNVAAVIKAVASDPYGIGMTGWVDAAAISADVKVVPLAADAAGPGITRAVTPAAITGKADKSAAGTPAAVTPTAVTPTAATPTAVTPAYADVAAGRYPYSSHVRFYVNRPPGQALPPFIKAYLEMVLSPEGQAIIAAQRDTEGGYVPLAPDQIAAERQKLQ